MGKGFPSGASGKEPTCEFRRVKRPWFFPIWGDHLEEDMETHSSILAWRIPWTEKPGRLQSMGSQRFGHDWVTYKQEADAVATILHRTDNRFLFPVAYWSGLQFLLWHQTNLKSQCETIIIIHIGPKCVKGHFPYLWLCHLAFVVLKQQRRDAKSGIKQGERNTKHVADHVS